jgi:hypothetical protein
VLHLYPLQSADQQIRPERDLPVRTRARCPGGPVSGVSRGDISEIYPDKSQDEAGLQRYFKQFSFLFPLHLLAVVHPDLTRPSLGGCGPHEHVGRDSIIWPASDQELNADLFETQVRPLRD